MALFLKFVCSCWRIQHLVLLKFFVVHNSEKGFLNEGVEYGHLGDSVNYELLESSAWVVLKCG